MYPDGTTICLQRVIMDDQIREPTTKGTSIFCIFLKVSIIKHTIIFSALNNRKERCLKQAHRNKAQIL